MTDHVVYVDAKSKARDLEEIIEGSRTMIIRGAAGRKLPYGKVFAGDVLYLIRNNAEGLVRAKCSVKFVLNSEKMDKETSTKLVEKHQEKLHLTPKQFDRWAGKRYLCLIEIENVEKIVPFVLNKANYPNTDDWIPCEDIENVRKES